MLSQLTNSKRADAAANGSRQTDLSGRGTYSLRNSNSSGFTLVELLVVIGLIGLLIAMLLPTLGKVRKQAGMVQCSSNLRQIGIAWTMYLNDSHGRFPAPFGNIQWFYGGKQPSGINSDPTKAGLVASDRLLNPYVGSRLQQEQRAAVFRCPKDGPIQGNPGISLTAGQDCFDYYGNSYTMNSEFFFRVNPKTFAVDTTPVSLRMVHYPSSRVMLVGDCNWYYLVNGGAWNADFHQAGHKVNLVFLDGHAATVSIIKNEDVTDDYCLAIAPMPGT